MILVEYLLLRVQLFLFPKIYLLMESVLYQKQPFRMNGRGAFN